MHVGELIGLITIWDVVREDGVHFNHISDGFSPGLTEPEPNCGYQRLRWRGRVWFKRPAFLVGNEVVDALGVGE